MLPSRSLIIISRLVYNKTIVTFKMFQCLCHLSLREEHEVGRRGSCVCVCLLPFNLSLFEQNCGSVQLPLWKKKRTQIFHGFSKLFKSQRNKKVLEECVAILFPSSQPWTLAQDLSPGKLLKKWIHIF